VKFLQKFLRIAEITAEAVKQQKLQKGYFFVFTLWSDKESADIIGLVECLHIRAGHFDL